MPPKDFINPVSNLSQKQREVLRLVCDGSDYKTIAEHQRVTVSTVKTHMQQVYIKLGLKQFNDTERLKILFEVYCPMLRGELPSPTVESEEPEPVPDEIREIVEKDAALIPWNPPGALALPSALSMPPPGPKPLWRFRLLVIGMLLGVLLIAVIVIRFGGFARGETKPGEVIMTVATTEPRQVTVAVTVLVTPTPGPLAPTATPVVQTVVVTQPIIVIVTATPPPQTSTPQSTDTPIAPTDTSSPTVTPTSSGALLFQDSFDQGLRPEWRILSGQPIMVNGRLGAAIDEVDLEIGNNSWGTYTVDLDFYDSPNPLVLIIAQRLRYKLYFNYGVWEAFQNNQWVNIARSGGMGGSGHLRLIVASNSYKVFLDGKAFFDVTYGEQLHGPFGFSLLKDRGFIDNLSITSP